MSEKAYEAIELAKKTGKIVKGTNEVTKAIERGKAKLVVVAKDVSPPEISLHLPMLGKEKGITVIEVPKREELGAAAGLPLSTTAVAIVAEGEAKDIVKDLTGGSAPEEPKEEAPKAEEKKEEKAEGDA